MQNYHYGTTNQMNPDRMPGRINLELYRNIIDFNFCYDPMFAMKNILKKVIENLSGTTEVIAINSVEKSVVIAKSGAITMEEID